MKKLIFALILALIFAFEADMDVFTQNSPISPLPTPTHRPAPPWLRTPEPTPVPIIGTAVFIENMTPTPPTNVIFPTMTPPPPITVTGPEPTPIPMPTIGTHSYAYGNDGRHTFFPGILGKPPGLIEMIRGD